MTVAPKGDFLNILIMANVIAAAITTYRPYIYSRKNSSMRPMTKEYS